jgi:hypothetical protein
MLLPLVFFAPPPPAFVTAVGHRLTGSRMHVVDWWADDLDGDKVPEAIARVCDDNSGVYLIQRGSDLLEVPYEIDGRNDCSPNDKPPEWHTAKLGVIADEMLVHHGSITHVLAIRDGRLALLRMESNGFDVTRTGNVDGIDVTDYEKLTWQHRYGRSASRGPLVLATPHLHRATKLVGGTTLTATPTGDNQFTLQVHADRAVTVLDCSSTPCTTTAKLAKGDHDVPGVQNEVTLSAGGTRYEVHLEAVDTDQAYPPPSAM